MTRATLTAQQLDREDELSHLIDKFVLPEGCIYLDGNSLGPLTKDAQRIAKEVIENQWGLDLIGSWNKHQWIDLPYIAGDKIARLIGANSGEVICCDSVSINLFKVINCALALNPTRNVVLSQDGNFPTDLYITQGIEKLLGSDNCRLEYVSPGNIEASLNEEVAVLLLTQVDFRSGTLLNMESITRQAHDRGILVVWDLAHSAGAIPLELNFWNVDFAVGCGYKYLHGGPGAPAFIFAASRFHQELNQPLQGWMGHKAPFEFESDYNKNSGIGSFLVGTPPIVSMSILNAALDVFDKVSIGAVRKKAIALSRFFQHKLDEAGLESSLQLISPADDKSRGNQLAYSHPNAYAICQALIAKGVICDFRNPDILRMGFSPMFLSFQDIQLSVEILATILREKTYLAEEFSLKQKVT